MINSDNLEEGDCWQSELCFENGKPSFFATENGELTKIWSENVEKDPIWS